MRTHEEPIAEATGADVTGWGCGGITNTNLVRPNGATTKENV
ncbi:hypothetical protein FHS23_001643 [Prauserella isguenensis]|uniref:Uncharacterized protein n=1 Tax=Prauserella isguenensis TaxID=1470180 RepID=A0A839RYG0_9PSEU|nr:hypothetical protein [Prauserella isguenensis]MBB3050648.1 hypothetical protein [Prauserella isguenensis]